LYGTARWLDPFKGGLDISSIHGQFGPLCREHPAGCGRTVLRHALGESIALSLILTGSLNNDRFLVVHQPVDQGRWQVVVHVKQFAAFPDGSIREEHD
jgi:hypothetical protein